MKKILLTALILPLIFGISDGQLDFGKDPSAVTVARLKYDGGGNWYWGRSAIPNLHNFLATNTSVDIHDEEINITATDPELFKYPFLFLTGHGNISFSDDETAALRKYLENGGFIFANDSYGILWSCLFLIPSTRLPTSFPAGSRRSTNMTINLHRDSQLSSTAGFACFSPTSPISETVGRTKKSIMIRRKKGRPR
jgi:hypothetical protein